MCGRYYIAADDISDELRQIIAEVNRKYEDSTLPITTAGEIKPTNIVPVITADDYTANPSVQVMRWGYTLPDGNISINARSEDTHKTRMYQIGMQKSRCLIPATSYFEWRSGIKPKPKYEIRPATGNCMYMAGLFRWEGDMQVFSILTRQPAECIKFIHDRMPVILPSDIALDWLNTAYRAEYILSHANLNVIAESLMPEQIRMEI